MADSTMDKRAFERAANKLRADLLDAQFNLKESGAGPLLLVVSGMDAAGKSETVNLLNEWMDPRHIVTRGFFDPDEAERQRPPMWRFWRELPAQGEIGIFFSAWYGEHLLAGSRGRQKKNGGAGVEEIKRFEQMFTAEGGTLVKYWFHLSKEDQARRFKKLSADPDTRWRVTEHDWKLYKRYNPYVTAAAELLRATHSEQAPWAIIDGSDEFGRSLEVGRHLLAVLRGMAAAKRGEKKEKPAKPPRVQALLPDNPLNKMDLTLALADAKYDRELEKWQGRLNRLTRHPKFRQRSVVLVFEGNDAAGKGGAIRRVTAALDARRYRSVPIAAPTQEERTHPYLWRFWRHVPAHGQFTIFDRSWYGRVLVERVEGFCSEADWRRAYDEINDFERQLGRSDAVVCKFWLAISPDEQLKRFNARENTRFKRFKITPDDWRNRGKWDAYFTAAGDMIGRTSTKGAPWTLVPANDKRYARILVLRTVVERIEAVL